jgi:hypothetical protein
MLANDRYQKMFHEIAKIWEIDIYYYGKVCL